jgi:hypothetical protein
VWVVNLGCAQRGTHHPLEKVFSPKLWFVSPYVRSAHYRRGIGYLGLESFTDINIFYLMLTKKPQDYNLVFAMAASGILAIGLKSQNPWKFCFSGQMNQLVF